MADVMDTYYGDAIAQALEALDAIGEAEWE